MEGKCSNLVSAGVCVISTAPSVDPDRGLAGQGPCTNARASVVAKQSGADPNMPGPGQYVGKNHRSVDHVPAGPNSEPLERVAKRVAKRGVRSLSASWPFPRLHLLTLLPLGA